MEGQKPFSHFRKNVTIEMQGLEFELEIRKQNPWGAKAQNLRSLTPEVCLCSGKADGIVEGHSQTSEGEPKPQR